MEVLIHSGRSVLIDETDLELVSRYRWSIKSGRNTEYAVAIHVVDGRRKCIMMHRLILGVTDRSIHVDHRDGNGLNNQRSNIRACSHAENMRNSKPRAHSKSGIRGVSLQSCSHGRRLWRGIVVFNGVRHKKWFNTKELAHIWVEETRRELHGEFAHGITLA